MSNNFNLSQAVNTPFSFRNKIINGNFEVWQRGFATHVAAGYYPDRWYVAGTISSWQFTRGDLLVGSEGLPGSPKYCLRGTVLVASSDPASYVNLTQHIENVATFSGKTVTISFYAKSTVSGKTIAVEVEQYFGTGGSPSAPVSVPVGQVALTTSWARYSLTVTLPSIAGKTLGTGNNDRLALFFWLDAGANFSTRTSGALAKATASVDFAAVQVEEGTVATPFEQRPIGLELSLCQRYYEKGTFRQIGYVPAGSFMGSSFSWKVTKRATPIVTGSATYSQMSTLTQGQVSDEHIYLYATATITGGNVWIYDFVADAEY